MGNIEIPYSFAKKHQVLLQLQEEGKTKISYTQVTPSKILLELLRQLKQPAHFEQINSEHFDSLLTAYYNAQAAFEMTDEIREELDLDEIAEQLPKPQDLLESQDEAPIIKLMNALLTQAVKAKASDIHIETYEERVLIRFRLDGVLRETLTLPRAMAPLLISRIKVMARLDIAEKRLPQDGRISLRIAGHTIDVRVSTLPSNHGERIVLRLLDKKVARLDLLQLGLDNDTYKKIDQLISYPNGIILVTGPTGAGKTTSLYAMLNQLNQSTRNILTVEDPIEYDLPGIGQTQVNSKIDMTFAKGLRAILRQDPDIVMVGEIRDLETVEIAIQASLTGHLVLSTLHTNSAIGAITRLRDMGVESFLLASTLVGVMAQRLVRVLCPVCKLAYDALPSEKKIFQESFAEERNPIAEQEHVTFYKATGCEHCQNSGYTGRIGVYEIILMDENLRQKIHTNQSELELSHYAHQWHRSLKQDGLIKVLSGTTSMDELLRVLY